MCMFPGLLLEPEVFCFQRAKGKVAIEVIIYRDQSIRPKLQKNKCLKKNFLILFRWVYKIFDFISRMLKAQVTEKFI